MDRSELRQEIGRANDAWSQALAGVSDTALETEAAAGSWSNRDLAGHTADWIDESLVAIEASLADEEAPGHPIEDGEGFNTEGVLKYAGMSWGEAKHHLDARVGAAQDLLARLEPDQLDAAVTYPWGGEGTIRDTFGGIVEHHDEHLNDIRNWLASRQ